MASSDTYASIAVASEGNLVPFINDRDDFERGEYSETKWYGSPAIYAGSMTRVDPFGEGGGPYLPGAPYFYNNDTSNTYLIYNVYDDGITQNVGVKKVIKSGTVLTFACYMRNRSAPSSLCTLWDSDGSVAARAQSIITWESTAAGAAVGSVAKTLTGTGSRTWYETVRTLTTNAGWIRVFCEVIANTTNTTQLRAELQPNTDESGTAAGSCYFWGPEVQYGSLNVTGDGDAESTSGGLYMSGGGVFDVECQVDVEYFRPIRRIPFASGHTYTSGIYRQDKRRWRVTVRAADLTVTQNLQSFFNSHNGMEHPFFFTTPITDTGVGFPWTSGAGHTADTQETVTGYFSEDVLHLQEIGPSVYDISFSVEELLVK